jgi:hypothetical protein
MGRVGIVRSAVRTGRCFGTWRSHCCRSHNVYNLFRKAERAMRVMRL